MKKSLSILLCLVLSLMMLAGCGAAGDTAPAATPEAATEAATEAAPAEAPAEAPAGGDGIARLQEKGSMILATESTYPPFQYLIVENGKTINAGLDVDIMRGFAESLGIELIVHEMAFDSIIPAVQAGQADFGGSFTPTPERAEAIDFSEIYYYNNHEVIVRKGEAATYPTIESFEGGRLGAQKGTIQESMIMEMEGIEVLGLPKVTSLIQELINGNINGILADASVANTYVAAYPDQVEKAPFNIPDESGGVAMLQAKDQPELLAALDAYILAGIEDGTIEELYQTNINAAIDQIMEAQE